MAGQFVRQDLRQQIQTGGHFFCTSLYWSRGRKSARPPLDRFLPLARSLEVSMREQISPCCFLGPLAARVAGFQRGRGRERGREGLQQRRDSPQYDGAISSQRVIHDCAIAAPPTTGLGWTDCHHSENSFCSGTISVLRLEEKSNQDSRRPYVALLPIGRITRAHSRASTDTNPRRAVGSLISHLAKEASSAHAVRDQGGKTRKAIQNDNGLGR